MTSFGDRVAREVKSWIDTPVVWGQSTKGAGCYCKGLLAGVARELGRPEAANVYALDDTFRPDRRVPVKYLKQGLEETFEVLPAGTPFTNGMVLLVRVRGLAQHILIVTDDGDRAVHADGWVGMRVRERSLASLLRMFPLDSAYMWRELASGG